MDRNNVMFVGLQLNGVLMSKLYHILFAMDIHVLSQKKENILLWFMIVSP